MAAPILKTATDLEAEYITRLVTYTSELTDFSEGSINRALARAVAGLAENGELHYKEMYRRATLMNATGAALVDVAAEKGATQRPAARAKVPVIFVPETFVVTAIADVGATTEITVANSSPVQVGDSIRIRTGDGATSETATVTVITSTKITTATLTNTATYSADIGADQEVVVLMRVAIPADTVLASRASVNFQTLTSVTTGDANAVLSGEGTSLGLLDKAWAEAVTGGVRGNIEAFGITGAAVAIRGLKRAYNPVPATGGEDVEGDTALKYRAAHGPTAMSQGTLAWYTALVQQADQDVSRVIMVSATDLRSVSLKVLSRSGSALSSARLTAIQEYLEDRVREGFSVTVANVTLTSVEISAVVTLTPSGTLEAAFRDAASRVANYLDYTRWAFGMDVSSSALLNLIQNSSGVSAVDISSFEPGEDVAVGDESLPVLTVLALEDEATGKTINADLTVSF